MRYLGLDLGSRTLGVAMSDSLGIIASSHGTIRHNEDYKFLLGEVNKLVNENKIETIILLIMIWIMDILIINLNLIEKK